MPPCAPAHTSESRPNCIPARSRAARGRADQKSFSCGSSASSAVCSRSRTRRGSIHEGGELGYALSHAFGAAFDNPDLIVACIVGDGEAETGPLATGWHGNKFLNPARDGCVLPILHFNGYKIANPCFLARIPKDELQKFFEGMGYTPYFVEGHDPMDLHQQLAGRSTPPWPKSSEYGPKLATRAISNDLLGR